MGNQTVSFETSDGTTVTFSLTTAPHSAKLTVTIGMTAAEVDVADGDMRHHARAAGHLLDDAANAGSRVIHGKLFLRSSSDR